MELIHAKYRVTNHFGSNIVSGEEARRVWETWPRDRRRGGLATGFHVWDVSEHGDTILMSTSYLPLADSQGSPDRRTP